MGYWVLLFYVIHRLSHYYRDNGLLHIYCAMHIVIDQQKNNGRPYLFLAFILVWLKYHKPQNLANEPPPPPPKKKPHQLKYSLCKNRFCYNTCPNLGGAIAYAKQTYIISLLYQDKRR